jgi:hypothetical protein
MTTPTTIKASSRAISAGCRLVNSWVAV